jgi:hypothetical protein
VSFNRNVSQDRSATRAVLERRQPIATGPRNWLGHRVDSGAAKIDEMLMAGATRHEMMSARGAVMEHIRHLREDHGLPIAEAGDTLFFNRLALGVEGDNA